jgi:hypothetical protein
MRILVAHTGVAELGWRDWLEADGHAFREDAGTVAPTCSDVDGRLPVLPEIRFFLLMSRFKLGLSDGLALKKFVCNGLSVIEFRDDVGTCRVERPQRPNCLRSGRG